MDLVESKQRIIPLEKRHPWELARLEVIKHVIHEHVDLEAGDNVLDIGCGDAFLVSQVAGDYPGTNFIAVDTALTPELAGTLNRAWSAPNVAMFEEIAVAGRSLNQRPAKLVLLLDVIEHIEDDIAFLRFLKSFPFITPQTTVVITVPAFQGLFCAHDKYLGHYRRYTNGMLNDHLSQAGYVPVKTSYFFSSLLLPRAAQVFKEKQVGIAPKMTTGLVEWNGSPVLARVLKEALLADFRFGSLLNKCGVNPWGLSNLGIFRPKLDVEPVRRPR